MDAYIGEIRIFCGTFAPRGWQFCWGQQMNIQQNAALYAVIGFVYGGNGQTTFNLPDLRGSVPLGTGTGAGLPTFNIGAAGGNTNYTLYNVPVHTHTLNGANVPGSETDVEGNLLGNSSPRSNTWKYSNQVPSATLAPNTLSPAGSSQPTPVSNMQPYLAMNYIICVSDGIFPVRS
ncbi:phage tail protein [Mucilaginibacter robiniae]|uniref:Phage tail protein n=1 Tax=Mucilaginibacter robiniae TaxID=2728022 RepID=A0A7L5DVV3_9SPHI|nr:tail fiber protein [Mucilaginibacter robiniae]QJD95220.1 phage tail protein [Mucilaginibacter robiniae]